MTALMLQAVVLGFVCDKIDRCKLHRPMRGYTLMLMVLTELSAVGLLKNHIPIRF